MLLKDFFETNKAAEESIIRPSLIKRRPFASAVFPLENMSATREDCEILGSTYVAPMLSITSKFLTFFSTKKFSTNRLYLVLHFIGSLFFLSISEAISETSSIV